MKLIKANLERIEAAFVREGKADVIVFDDTLKGFGLRLRSSGHRSWIVQYEYYGRSKRVTLGKAQVLEPDQARHLAKQELAKVALGADVSSDRYHRLPNG